MTRTMYDAVTVANVPTSATLVAGYGDGYYNNVAAFKARFPHATVVEIAVSSQHNLGVVLDVETGDATPAEAPGWVRMRRAAGVDPTVYCNSSTWPAVRAAFASAGVTAPHYWIAQYDGDPTIPAGAVAKQYADPGPYDLSSVAAYWPGVDPAPSEDNMPLTSADARTLWAYAGPGDHPDTHQTLQNTAASAASAAAGVTAANTAIKALAASVASIGTSVASIAAAVAKLGTADAALVADLAAAQTALAGIPARVEAALKDGTVHVDVAVTGPAPAAS